MLLLGWCDSQRDLEVVQKVVSQLCHAYEAEGGRVIVVMTQRAKLELEALFRRILPPAQRFGSQLVFRQARAGARARQRLPPPRALDGAQSMHAEHVQCAPLFRSCCARCSAAVCAASDAVQTTVHGRLTLGSIWCHAGQCKDVRRRAGVAAGACGPAQGRGSERRGDCDSVRLLPVR